MPEPYGKLDGLREIIHPAMPAPGGGQSWLVALLCLVVLLLLFYLYRRYRQRPLTRARRLFHQFRQQAPTLDAARCGDSLMAILRIYLNTDKLQAMTVPGFSRQEWQGLIDDCNHLRFSGAGKQPDIVSRAMDQTGKLLWPAR
jgi:cbb3-type cytochrome oxidase subunit 3